MLKFLFVYFTEFSAEIDDYYDKWHIYVNCWNAIKVALLKEFWLEFSNNTHVSHFSHISFLRF